MTDEPQSPITEEREAIEAIARTRDGRLLHRYLRRVLETVIDIQEGGALYAQNGRRSLARDLMRLMAEGIDERTSDSTGDTPILSRSARAVAVARPRRDRNAYPRVDSFSDDVNPDGSDPA